MIWQLLKKKFLDDKNIKNCFHIYDEEKGWPEDDIQPGTKWEDVPDTWMCPDCGATKSDFDMIEIT